MQVQVLPVAPCLLGESPFWHPAENRLYWCDIVARRVHAFDPATGRGWGWNVPSEPGCCAPTTAGNIVLGLREGFALLEPHSGQVRTLATLPAPHDARAMRLNDGKCDAAGRLWAGSMVQDKSAPRASLWCLQAGADGQYGLRHMASDCTTANGLAFQDGRMYWADTPAHRIDRFAFDSAGGTLGVREVWKRFADQGQTAPGTAYGGRPDGASVDAEGNYWVAMYEGGCVLQLAPDGTLLRRLEVPVRCPTMVCFGGDDLRTLFITSAAQGRPEAERQAAVPAGSLLHCRLEVPGQPVQFFREAAD